MVGSGPAGLTLAADMVAKGHSVTVFESLHKPGGVLVYGIPEFRLPKAIVEAEIDYLRRLGVKIEVNSIVGRLYTIDELFATGLRRGLRGHRRRSAGLHEAARREPLQHPLGQRVPHARQPHEGLRVPRVRHAGAARGRQVAVLGGGNVAMDCARTAVRMGSREVSIVYRRTRDEMPARTEEIEHAEQEGVQVPLPHQPDPLHRRRPALGASRWSASRCSWASPTTRAGRRPIPKAGSNFLMDVDMVIVAVGAGPEPGALLGLARPRAQPSGATSTRARASGRTSMPDVWAGGDIVTGSATVILAMGAARQAADDMHEYLMSGSKDWIPAEG